MKSQKHLLNLLIVEDDQNLASSIKILAPEGFKVFVAQKPNLVPDHVFFHAALVDMHLETSPPEAADGLEVIQKLTKRNPQTEIVAMSGNLDRSLMEKAIQSGAQRFLAKPLSAEELIAVLKKIESYWNLFHLHSSFRENSVQLIGNSQATENLRKTVSILTGEKTPVLIEGETGSGKDVVARILNQQEGPRPFVAVNCSSIPENLFESEFFGHIKGAFTGADQNRIGYAEAAHGGDLFLDEIEALPLSQQAKLLRFLESGELKKVGAKDSQSVDVRVIAASNLNLKEMINQKKFREDLYFRLAAHSIYVLPLRERKTDIKDIAQYFLKSDKLKRSKIFDESGIASLEKYDWPGNVRELKRVCEQLVLTSPLPIIRDVDVLRWTEGLGRTNNFEFNFDGSLDQFLTQQEKQFIETTIDKFKDLDQASIKLKISKSTLYKKIKDLNINYE
jgi:DNA-binding NtrC family response regulator